MRTLKDVEELNEMIRPTMIRRSKRVDDEIQPAVKMEIKDEFVCQRCRNCCVSFDLRVDKSEAEDLERNEFFKARGIYFYEGEDGFTYAHLHQNCPHLNIQGHGAEGKWACDIYMLRPRICQNYNCGGLSYIP